MKAERIFILSCCLVIFLQASANGQVLQPDSLHIGEISAATVDLFGNLYVGDQQGQLLKIEPAPLHIIRYSGRQTLGYDIIDAGSYNKIAVFSKNLQTVRFFDKNLNPLSELSLSPGYASSATCICISPDNKIWIFDETGPVLKKIDPVNGRVLQNIDCTSALNSGEVNITDMKEYNNRLYMLDGDHNIYVFNFMGNLLNTFRVRYAGNLQFHDDYLIAASQGHLIFYDLNDGTSNQKPFEYANNPGQFFFSENYIYQVSKNIVIRPAMDGLYKNKN